VVRAMWGRLRELKFRWRENSMWSIADSAGLIKKRKMFTQRLKQLSPLERAGDCVC